MSDSLNAILVLSYFPYSDFPGHLVCDGGDFGEMHTTKIVFVADTSTFFANVTGLIGSHYLFLLSDFEDTPYSAYLWQGLYQTKYLIYQIYVM